MTKPCPFGTHRVLAPRGALPQSADRLDTQLPLQSNELLIQVDTLNVDSASFTQIRQACQDDTKRMAEMILDIVATRGKLQNPVTGSGGVLLGRVVRCGPDYPMQLAPGTQVATLVSLSLTPLKIESIKAIHLHTDQVDITGEAILFATGMLAAIPEDMDQRLALSALDVAGAPAQVHLLVKRGDSVLVLGASGKSGVLCCLQARLDAGEEGHVVGVCYDEAEAAQLRALNVCHEIIMADARQPMQVYERALIANKGRKFDVSINVVNVPDTEMSAILPVKDSGLVYFFSMATSFTKAALGAEGVSSAAQMIIGNGYTPGHAAFTLNLLRDHPALKALFEQRYVRKD